MPAAPAREAATVVLIRNRKQGPPEMLMVQRHAEDKFAAGAFVFPGGVLEDNDFSEAAIDLSPRLPPAQAISLIPDAGSPEKALGFFVAAIRETFEEAGILLARTAAGEHWHPDTSQEAELREARDALHEGRLDFVPWMHDMGLSLATDHFRYFAHWITPEARPIRFDTHFFVIEVDKRLQAEADQREVQDHVWVTADEVLARHKAGDVSLVGATRVNLQLISEYANAADAVAGLSAREVVPIMPKLHKTKDGSVRPVFPWDPEYQTL